MIYIPISILNIEYVVVIKLIKYNNNTYKNTLDALTVKIEIGNKNKLNRIFVCVCLFIFKTFNG